MLSLIFRQPLGLHFLCRAGYNMQSMKQVPVCPLPLARCFPSFPSTYFELLIAAVFEGREVFLLDFMSESEFMQLFSPLSKPVKIPNSNCGWMEGGRERENNKWLLELPIVSHTTPMKKRNHFSNEFFLSVLYWGQSNLAHRKLAWEYCISFGLHHKNYINLMHTKMNEG